MDISFCFIIDGCWIIWGGEGNLEVSNEESILLLTFLVIIVLFVLATGGILNVLGYGFIGFFKLLLNGW